jgi:WD40 repeat protein
MKFLFVFLILMSFKFCFSQKTELVVPDGHTTIESKDWPIADFQYSLDGKFLATGGKDGSLILWETKSYKQIKKFLLSGQAIENMKFSNNGKLLAAVTNRGYAVIDILNTKILIQITGDDYTSAGDVAFTSDDKHLLLSIDNSVFFLDLAQNGKQIHSEVLTTNSQISFFEITKDFKKLIIATNSFNDDAEIIVTDYSDNPADWNRIISKKITKVVKGKIKQMVLNEANDRIIIDRYEYEKSGIQSINLNNLSEIADYVFNKNEYSLPWYPCLGAVYCQKRIYKYVANNLKEEIEYFALSLPGLKKGVALKQLPTCAQELSKYKANLKSSNCFAIYKDRLLATALINDEINIWGFYENRIIKTLSLKLNDGISDFNGITQLKFDNSGNFLYVLQRNQLLKFETSTWKKTWAIEGLSGFEFFKSLDIDSSGKLLAATTDNYGKIALYDAATGKLINNKNGQNLNCTISPNGKYILISGSKETSLLKIPSLEVVQQYPDPDMRYIEKIFFAPNLIDIYALKEGEIYKFKTDKPGTELIYRLPGYSSGITYAGLIENGNQLEFSPFAADGKNKLYTLNLSTSSIEKEIPIGNIKQMEKFKEDEFYFTTSFGGLTSIRNKEGKLVAEMFYFNDGNDWVIRTPDGRFDGTEKGIKKLYYQKSTKFLSLDKLYEKYYTPGLLKRLLAGEKFPIIENPDDLKPKPASKILYAEKQRNLEVRDDKPSYTNTTGIAEITVNAIAPEDKIDEIRLFHNGKVITLATRGMFVTDNDGTDSKKYTVNLLPGTNNFRAVALNSQRTESDADEITVSYTTSGSQPTPPPNKNNAPGVVPIDPVDKNATMYLMVVGINAYKDKIRPLTYALPDATAFKEEVEKDAKSMLANIKTYFISDAKADKAGIINAFTDIKQNAKPQDVFVFYYAGHGYIHPGTKEFYLLSADVADGGESLLKNGVPAKELQQYAVDILAQKQLFILDACQSAGAFEKMLQHDGEQQKALAVVSRSTGTHWMAASGSTETAKEFAQLGHGAFTYVLLQALKGQAAANKMITVNGLKNFLLVQVPELVKKYGGNSQYPASYGSGNDFPVEVLK